MHDSEILKQLIAAGFPCKPDQRPTIDELNAEVERYAPYIKIRRLPVGYFMEGMTPRPQNETERWGCTIDGEGTDYSWCKSLWQALALAYIRLRAQIADSLPSK